ncbi:MAG: hypothetical protein LAO79_21265, partial [Acidobacteriia bacterium]|nr:hypothetical protein [Terriglobia bacterium]
MISRMRRAPLATLACLLVLVKAIQYAIDSTAIFYFDSGAFILNALGALFHPTRSYFWGYLMRAVALPFHSLRAIVATQVAMGAVTAWLLGFMLLRFLRVRPTVAVLAALVFSIDPLQVVHERLVMAECAALFVMALFLIAAADYLEAPRWWKPGILALLGVVLVGMRIVYLPLVVLAAVLLPVAAYVWSPGLNNVRSLVATLAISCAATVALQLGYTHLTGWLAGREAAYNYEAGFFQLSGVAPIVDASDSDDPRVTRAIEEQNRTAFPLANARLRPRQLWDAQGIRLRLTAAFNGDERAANEAAQKLARTAIRRHPLRYARLGAHTYLEFWRYYRGLRHSALYEVGMAGNEIVKP